ncbi:twin-arginine translocase TatA/TatE family subunit [Sulfurivirga sp.]|uniref:Sec-independent protein translocase subunit TatA/TatB n=1 Tax=Sulfurivirga sp. TaxID=2614236 RepID=UPI0025E1856D|nr:twin-arginine translocase TatA/TatE family subunit [Sulfurivirga sp.]
MFSDVGGLELFLVLIIALLVIGPQRMPEVARQIGRFVGKTRRFIQSVREESELRETVEQLRRELDLREEAETLRQVERDLQNDLYGNLREAQETLQDELNLEELQRPTFGGEEPPPLHAEFNDPERDGVRPTAERPDSTRNTASGRNSTVKAQPSDRKAEPAPTKTS